MPPYTFPSARLLYVLTALVAASIVLTLDFAGAGQPEAQCKGNSPKKICPDLTPANGATVSATVLVAATSDEPVGSMTFEVDDKALAPPDSTAPYEIGWDTTKWSNGTHVLKATAVDAGGKASSREHRVDVANADPKPTDTTAPSVGLTSPSAGATVSGAVSVAATATDNVAVVGVQFKVDGSNVGAEDTSAPYAASWNSASVSNGGHTVTAVARDAAGNSSSSQHSVTVSNSASSSSPKLTWAPPALSNPVVITVTNANRRLYLDNTRDYRLNIAEPLKRELWIDGGRNVVVIGGHITLDQLGSESSYQDNTAVKLRGGAAGGTIHLEGLLIDGAYAADGIALATPRNIQIQNVRIESVTALKGAHPDCIQTQQGAGAIRIDRFTCTTQLQGIFLRDDLYAIGPSDFRHVNITGNPGGHLLWQQTPRQPISLTDFWLDTGQPWAPFGWWVYPQQDGKTWDGKIDMTRVPVVSADGTYLTFSGSTNTISGRINKGRPPGGDFVTRSSVGSNYISPGYA
jgi:Big-like domain-containing protein